MTPMQEALEGLVIEYKKGKHTEKQRDAFMRVFEKVLDYFVPIKEG